MPNNKTLDELRSALKGLVFICLLISLTTGSRAAFAATTWSAADYDLYPGNFTGPGTSQTGLLFIAKDASKDSGIVLSDGSGPNVLWQTWPSNYLGINWSGHNYNVIVADFNHDGRADILLQAVAAGGTSYLLLTDTTGHVSGTPQSILANALGLTWTSDKSHLVAGDFNGDGYTDLFFQSTSKSGTDAIVLANPGTPSNLFSAGPAQTWSDGYLGLNWSTQTAIIYAGNFDGDQYTDLLVQARPKFVMIDYDVPFPVPVYPPNLNGVVFSLGGSAPFPSTDTRVTKWSRYAYGVDWSPLTNNLVVGQFTGTARSDILLQALHSSGTSYLLAANGTSQVFGSTPTAISSSAGMSADQTRLIVTNFTGSSTGLYYQAASASGTNYIANNVGASTTATAATNYSPGSPTGQASSLPIVAGRTPGTFAVNADGAASYTIPLVVPPGVGTLQLKLNLSYDSLEPNGVLGMGWGIGGLSAITRCARTVAQDGYAQGITLSLSDRFCLDGRQLKWTGGTYGQPGSTYATETESFSLIAASTAALVGQGPASFTVTTKNGLIYTYGGTSNSQIMAGSSGTIRVWALSQIADRVGNKINLSYYNDSANGSYRIYQIQYPVTATGQGPYYSVTFGYSPRPGNDVPSGYIAGYLVREPNQLNTITTSTAAGAVIKTYNLHYTQSQATNRNTLTSIQECSAANCLNPTSIAYQPSSQGWTSTVQYAGAAQTNSDASDLGPFPGDFDGDGRTDILYVDDNAIPAQSYPLSVTLASGSGYGQRVITNIATMTYCAKCWNSMPPLIGKVLGNGRDQILVPQTDPSTNVVTWYMYDLQGSVFVQTNLHIPANGEFALADIDGDGLADLLSVTTTGLWARHNTVGSGGSTIFAATAQQVFAGTNLYNTVNGQATVKVADFNGDGLADILVPSPSGNCGSGTLSCAMPLFGSGVNADGTVRPFVAGPYTNIPYINNKGTLATLLDWNGDGCSDLLWGNSLYLSNCSTTFTIFSLPSSIANSMSGTFYFNPIAADWDGDGKEDILYPNADKTVHVIRSTGGDPATAVDEPTGISAVETVSQSWFTLDQSGDGRMDLAMVYANSQGIVMWYPHNGGDSAVDAATSFTDGYGMNESPSYVPLTNSSYYTKCTAAVGCTPASYPEEDYQGPTYVVGNFTASDGTGTNYQDQFQYWTARRDLKGRGLEGFAKRQTYDSRNGTYTVEVLAQKFPQTGTVLSRQSLVGTTPLLSWSATPQQQTLGTGFEQRYFPYVSSTTEQEYEIGAKANQIIKQTARSYVYADGYGNLTSETVTVTDQDSTSPASPFLGQSWQQVTTKGYLNDTSAWCIGLETSSSIQSTVPGITGVPTSQTTQTRADQSIPDPNHQLCRIGQHIQEPGIPALTVSTQYGFDSCGNTSSIAVTGHNSDGSAMPVRTTLTDFSRQSGRCQLPEAITNQNNETTLISYNYNFGVVQAKTDANALQTVWSQDDFGRTTRVARPDGTSETYAYKSCDKSNNFCGIADLRTEIVQQLFASDGSLVRNTYQYTDGFSRIRYKEYNRVLGVLTNEGFVYDNLGREIVQYLPFSTASNGFKTFSYDVLDRRTAENLYRSDGSVDRSTSWTYLGNTINRLDPRSYTTVLNSDVAGKLRKVTDPSPGGVTAYGYGAFGKVVQIVDATGATSSAQYDQRGFRIQLQDADEGTWNFSADSLQELTGWTDAKNQSFGASYDPLGRMTSRSEPEGTSSWTWGRVADNTSSAKYVGTLRLLTGPGYSEVNTPDQYARLSTKTITTDQSYTYTYAYNALGTLDSLAYPSSPVPSGSAGANYTVKYGYSYGHLSSITDVTNPAAPAAIWSLSSANDYSSPTSEVLGTGAGAIGVTASFLPWTNEVTILQSGVNGSGTNVQNLAYSWDQNGNLLSRQDYNQNLTESFGFDPLNRLTTGTLNGQPDLAVSYDAAGNITQRTDTGSNPATYLYSDPAHKHAVTSTSATPTAPALSYTYDANGNVSQKNTLTYSWASYNLPTSVQANVGGTILTSTFSYGPAHERVKQVATYSNGTETTYYVGNTLEKMVSSNGVTYWRHYVKTPGGRTLIVSRNSDGTTTSQFALTDHLGSSDAVVNAATGAVTARESFNAFGVRRGSTWTGSPSTGDALAIASTTRHGFTFHEHLDNVGLIHMGGRVYDPMIGRFLSVDPVSPQIGDSQSPNPYSYVRNRPLTLTDPTGLADCDGSSGNCNPSAPPPPPSQSAAPQSSGGLPMGQAADARYQSGTSAQVATASKPIPGGADGKDAPESSGSAASPPTTGAAAQTVVASSSQPNSTAQRTQPYTPPGVSCGASCTVTVCAGTGCAPAPSEGGVRLAVWAFRTVWSSLKTNAPVVWGGFGRWYLRGLQNGPGAAIGGGAIIGDGAAVTAESLDALANADRIGSALKADAYHAAPTWADTADVAANGQQFSITGGDGVTRTLVQSPATVNDTAGRFEWVINSDGTISHQLFVPGGTLNGVPIRP